MDRFVTATEANQRFSEMLREVGQGESFIVTSRGKPLARMSPVGVKAGGNNTSEFHAYLRSLPQITHNWQREDLYE
jgi:prevent-host-death family protein